MTKFVLKDHVETWQNLLPLTFTRSIADCRVGIMTIHEKWQKYLGENISIQYADAYLGSTESSSSISIASNVLPTEDLVKVVSALTDDQALYAGDMKLAQSGHGTNKIDFSGSVSCIQFPWDIFLLNGQEIDHDYKLLTKNRISQKLSETNTVLGQNIFLEEGATVECAILNSNTGPIYIAAGAEIMEGAIIRGPFAIGAKAQIKMGAKIYGPTTIGPSCKVGGEITNSIFFANSNKAHDGYIGNSVIGEWCNLGADTNSSNLKNNYSSVEVYNYTEKKAIATGQQFCGLIMGDHSKCGINTMFNTGTVVGVSANIVGADFPKKHIPSFSWSIGDKLRTYDIEKSIETAKIVYARRGILWSERDESVLRHIYTVSTSPSSSVK